MKYLICIVITLSIQTNIFASTKNLRYKAQTIKSPIENLENNRKLQKKFKIIGIYNGPIDGKVNEEFLVALRFLLRTYMKQ